MRDENKNENGNGIISTFANKTSIYVETILKGNDEYGIIGTFRKKKGKNT